MIDYYGLPEDAPGMKTRPPGVTAVERVRHVEDGIFQDLGSPAHFAPFLALHEFEAWLYSDIEVTASVMLAPDKVQELRQAVGGLNPEEINEGIESAPSKRLLRVFPAFRKALHGPTAAKRMGLDAIRSRCPHFNEWMKRLEQAALA